MPTLIIKGTKGISPVIARIAPLDVVAVELPDVVEPVPEADPEELGDVAVDEGAVAETEAGVAVKNVKKVFLEIKNTSFFPLILTAWRHHLEGLRTGENLRAVRCVDEVNNIAFKAEKKSDV